VAKNRERLDLYILPYFGRMTLRSVTKSDVEKWLVWLRSLVSDRTRKPLAPKTVNNIRSVLLLMFKEAEQNRLIESNPVAKTLPMLVDKRPRKLLSVAEVLTLLDPGRIEQLWNGNRYYYVASLLTAVTGMREGEVRAL
jgi:integrase